MAIARPVPITFQSFQRIWLSRAAAMIGIGLLGWALYLTGWLADDSLITIRVVINLFDGLGPVWWPGERVQVFTHPLWFGVLSATYGVTGEAFRTTILTGAATTLMAVMAGLWPIRAEQPSGPDRPDPRLDPLPLSLALLPLLLSASRSVVDFGTSGMENPLSYLLVALLWRSLANLDRAVLDPASRTIPSRAIFWPVLLAALLLLNRMDFAIFVACLTLPYWRFLRLAHIGPILLGLTPLLLWIGFATFYYGSPLPNTYFAKQAGGHETAEYLTRAINYYRHFPNFDPAGLFILVAGLIAALGGPRRARALALGVVAYLLYLLPIGGDFMAGRFFTVPIFAAALILAHSRFLITAPKLAALVTGGALLIGYPYLPWFNYQDPAPLTIDLIADQRRKFSPNYGLILPDGTWRTEWTHIESRAKSGTEKPATVRVICAFMGVYGLNKPHDAYIIDYCGLTNALMARLPAVDVPNWRIGHLRRVVPNGYAKSLRTGQNWITQPGVAALYEDIRLATEAPLLAEGRWQAIWRLHTKAYLSDEEIGFYRNPANLGPVGILPEE